VTGAAREAWELIAGLLLSEETHARLHNACEELGISPPMLKALLSLAPGEARPMRSLADHLRCDASWVTSLVDGLEEHGFVERRVLPTDRRVKTILLTEQGAIAQKQALDHLNEPPRSFQALTATEARQLRDLLRKACGR
jgi:DNA-binding MarR family transcriptional regulator